MPIKKTTEQFINESINIHGNKYDYSKVIYENNCKKVIIICKEHGEFLKSPQTHLAGQGCRICNGYVVLNQQSFLDRAIKKHEDLYDYSKTTVLSKHDKVIIICRIHAEFHQLPGNHISGQGCPDCAQINRTQSQRYSTKEFIESVRLIHKEKYDYSKVNYINSQTKVEIICLIHGSFKMKANSHFNGQGCPICGRISANLNIALDYSVFLKRAEKIHNNQYTYNEESYINYTSKLNIYCNEHGYFSQTPHSHISMKTGCPKCGLINATKKRHIEWDVVHDLFLVSHGNRYEYDKSTYVNVTKKINIKCKEHGWFLQKPFVHYGGSGCDKCGYSESAEKKQINFEEFVIRSIEKHGNIYKYNKSGYINIFKPTEIECSKHGVFFQTPRNHYRGSGCPKCISSRGETQVRLILERQNIKFQEQKIFDDLIHKNKLRCDFYLPEYNTVIEYNGLQHYEQIPIFGGINGLILTQKRDLIKYNYFIENKINLIIIRFDNNNISDYIIKKLTECKEIGVLSISSLD